MILGQVVMVRASVRLAIIRRRVVGINAIPNNTGQTISYVMQSPHSCCEASSLGANSYAPTWTDDQLMLHTTSAALRRGKNILTAAVGQSTGDLQSS